MKYSTSLCFSLALATIILINLIPATASAETTGQAIDFFQGPNGEYPLFGLTLDSAGNLYGSTPNGGTNQSDGIVYELSRSSGTWHETVLYDFCAAASCADGATPYSAVIFDAAGNLYGTTLGGGANGGGTVFKLSPSAGGWTETVLYSFCSLASCADGKGPVSVAFDAAGNLYGSTYFGGQSCTGTASGCGVVFKLSPPSGAAWKETVLFSFSGSNGQQPNPVSFLDSAGNLYGTTYVGGTENQGVVFELSPTAKGPWTQTLLHVFMGPLDGAWAQSPLISDSSGNIYGTTVAGGYESVARGAGYGTIFKLSPSTSGWTETVLHRFSGPDGQAPFGGLVRDANGIFYGTTTSGAEFNAGLVFQLSQGVDGIWQESSLYVFDGNNGFGPYSTLTLDQSGHLYGTTQYGGLGEGIVFELKN